MKCSVCDAKSMTLVVVLVVLCLLVPDIDCQSQCSYGCVCGAVYMACYSISNLYTIPHSNRGLKTMYIVGGHLHHLSEDDFQNYTALVDLKLPSNEIGTVSSSTFAKNDKLEVLNMGSNEIADVQPGTFRNLTVLRKLILDGNRLHHINDEAFLGLSSLLTLSLKDNNISTILSSAVEPLGALEALELSGNPLMCDCAIAWMVESAAIAGAGSPATCSSPESLAGRDVTTLTYADLNCVVPRVVPANMVVRGYRGDQGLELECVIIEGDPDPEVSWYVEGAKLSNSSQYRITDGGNLQIVLLLPQHIGEYVCVAENLVGSGSATINVELAGDRDPVITRSPTDTHSFVGSTFFLCCEANPLLIDTYQWVKDGVMLSTNSEFTVDHGYGIEIWNARKEHSGKYSCVVSNGAGTVNVSATVDVTSAVITCDGIFSPSMMEDLRDKINLAFNKTQQELQRQSNSPRSLLRKLNFPESGIIEHLKAAEVFDQAVTILRSNVSRLEETSGEIPVLTACELEVLGELSGCKEHQREADCSSCYHQKYRSVDGSCNNLDYPLMGASEVPFMRLLTPSYEDGVGLPVGWSGGKPSARHISRELIAANEVTGDEHFTLMLMQFGQFLDHDMDMAPGSPSDIVFDIRNPESLSTCDNICENDAPCFPIPVPHDDHRINRSCMAFTRSSAVCGSGVSSLLLGGAGIHREQINAITSYLDGSMIYGSIEYVARRLREQGDSGKLLEGDLTESGKKLLPFDNESLIECSTGIHANRSSCFLGGDARTNEQVGLTSMHTLFYREHNRVVAILASLNPQWDGERLYQEARRIVVAEWQHLVYYEYLPKILGSSYLGDYPGYDPTVDTTIANGFATAAFRFGHSQIMPLFPRLDFNYEPLPIGPLKLQDAFFAPFRIIEEGGIDPLLRGLVSSPVKMRLSHQGLNNNLTEALFLQAHEIGLDLAALNIQRGRDHGIPNYNNWRSFCNLTAPSSMDGLQEHISNATIRMMLEAVYGDDPSNVDLWVGGLLEDPLPATQLGPTFQCIIGEQFRRLRNGDRFYYERQGQFTPDQLVQLNQASLSRILCDNADNIHHVPMDAFILQDKSEFTSCSDIPRVDLTMWQECNECEQEGSSRAKRSSALFKSNDDFDGLLNKLSDLAEKVGVCRFNGAFYSSGESWSLSKCIKCHCQSGDVQCDEDRC